jgi:hypothetical protein
MELRTEIEIDAPPEKVWQALVDFASYPDWNPFIREVSGELAEGQSLRLVLTPGDGSEKSLVASIARLAPNQELRWRRKLLFQRAFAGEHFWKLTPLDDGRRTRLLHGEDFTGFLVQYMGPTLTHTARGCVGMNVALKKLVETSRGS